KDNFDWLVFQRVLSIYKEFLFQFQGFLFPIPGIISLQHTLDHLCKVIAVFPAQDAADFTVFPEKAVAAVFRLIREIVYTVNYNCFSPCFISHSDTLHEVVPSRVIPEDDKSPVMSFVTTGLCKISIFTC
ncbi:MAG: hypothetical protein MSH32_02975, partial [Lachnospiraceae bacterium]|nr:hypothetical protein [Lachnospiraceae bacterium]